MDTSLKNVTARRVMGNNSRTVTRRVMKKRSSVRKEMSRINKRKIIMSLRRYICRNMSGHTLMGRPAAIMETMVLVIHSYVLIYIVGKRL